MVKEENITKKSKGLSRFERYLSMWVLLCIAAGIFLGKIAPGIAAFLDGLAIYAGEAPVVYITHSLCLFFFLYTIFIIKYCFIMLKTTPMRNDRI